MYYTYTDKCITLKYTHTISNTTKDTQLCPSLGGPHLQQSHYTSSRVYKQERAFHRPHKGPSMVMFAGGSFSAVTHNSKQS